MRQKALVLTEFIRFFKFSSLIPFVILVIITSTYPCFAFPPLEPHQKLTQKAENQKQDSVIAHPANITRRIRDIHMNTMEPIEFKLIDTRDNKETK